MSRVKNPDSFRSLAGVNVIQPSKDFRVKFLGFYDPEYGVNTEYAYKAGTLRSLEDRPIYDDSHLDGRGCAFMYFKHRALGHNFLSKKLGKGHWHTKCFVSANNTNLWDCATRNEKDDIFFVADLCEDMPITLDDETYALYVLRPALTPDEISALAMKSITTFEWKADMLTASTKVAKSEAREIVATKMMAQAIVTKNIYAKQIDNLIKLLAIAQEKLFDNTGKGVEVLINLGDRVEKEFDLGLLGPEAMKDSVTKMIERQSKDLSYIQALTKAEGDDSELMKREVFDTCVNYVGLDYMKKWLNIVELEGSTNSILTPSMVTANALEKRNLKDLNQEELFKLVNRLTNLGSKQFDAGVRSENPENEINNLIDNTMIKMDGEEKDNKLMLEQ